MPKAATPQEKMQKIEAKIMEERGIVVDSIPEDAKPQIRRAPDRPQRKERGVFNGTRGKLKISEAVVRMFEEAGWHLHIFNDTAGRIEDALSLGYEFVTRDELGNTVSNVVDSNTDLGNKARFRVGQDMDGNGLFAYLMKIPKSIFLEEQKILQKRNDLIDAAIRSGKNTKQGTTNEGFYDAGIKY